MHVCVCIEAQAPIHIAQLCSKMGAANYVHNNDLLSALHTDQVVAS